MDVCGVLVHRQISYVEAHGCSVLPWLWLWLWLSGPLGEGAHEDGAKDEGGGLGAAVLSAAVQLRRDHSAHA